MKCITNGVDSTIRVSDEVAEQKVRTGRYKYISKSEYKQITTLQPVVTLEPEIKQEVEQKKSNKLQKRLKLKEKQK